MKRRSRSPSGCEASSTRIAVDLVEVLVDPPLQALRLTEAGPGTVEEVQFLDRRHPELGMEGELVVEPARAGLLRADADEIGTGAAPGAGRRSGRRFRAGSARRSSLPHRPSRSSRQVRKVETLFDAIEPKVEPVHAALDADDQFLLSAVMRPSVRARRRRRDRASRRTRRR